MKNYIIKILLEGELYTEFAAGGSNAIDAFENAVEAGQHVPSGVEFDVLALSERMVGIRFKAITSTQ